MWVDKMAALMVLQLAAKWVEPLVGHLAALRVPKLAEKLVG